MRIWDETNNNMFCGGMRIWDETNNNMFCGGMRIWDETHSNMFCGGCAFGIRHMGLRERIEMML